MPVSPHSFEPAPDVYRGMIDAAPDAMVVVDSNGVIRLVNNQAEAVFGHSREELLGRPIEVLIPQRFRPDHLQHRGDYAAQAGARPMGAGLELYAMRRDGQEFPVEISLSPLDTPQGRFFSAAIRDVSERKAIEQASERMRDELIATVSHELRTPLTSILGYTEILVDMGDEAVSEQAAQLLEIVRRNAERELRLVEDLLTLAFLGASALTVDPTPTDLGPLARSVREDLAAQAAEAGVMLTCIGLRTLWVDGDQGRLTQVVTNLVINAIKFTPAGGRVEVRLLSDGRHALLEVADDGVGLSPEEVPQVFDRLYRAPGAVNGQVPGAGLGLPIVKGIVEAHAGEIGVESRPGHGTTVTVSLPLASAPPFAPVPTVTASRL